MNHTRYQIIGDKYLGVITRNKLKNDTCLLCEFETRIVKDALENENWIKEMNEEVDQINK